MKMMGFMAEAGIGTELARNWRGVIVEVDKERKSAIDKSRKLRNENQLSSQVVFSIGGC